MTFDIGENILLAVAACLTTWVLVSLVRALRK